MNDFYLLLFCVEKIITFPYRTIGDFLNKYRMKRIVFFRLSPCLCFFLVMLVHASENYYGAHGFTDMVGLM